jgi:hypothetical protein
MRSGFVGLPTEVEGAETQLGKFEARAAHRALLDHVCFGFGRVVNAHCG